MLRKPRKLKRCDRCFFLKKEFSELLFEKNVYAGECILKRKGKLRQGHQRCSRFEENLKEVKI